METNFFSSIKHYLENKDVNLSISLKDDRMICSVIFRSKDENDGKTTNPVIISGTIEEMDKEFIETLGKPVAKAEKILGLSVDDTKMESEDDSAKKKPAKVAPVAKVKPLTGKPKEGLQKATEYFEKGDLDKAEVHLKGTCKDHMSHPDVVALLEKITGKEENSEEESEDEESEEESPDIKPTPKVEPAQKPEPEKKKEEPKVEKKAPEPVAQTSLLDDEDSLEDEPVAVQPPVKAPDVVPNPPADEDTLEDEGDLTTLNKGTVKGTVVEPPKYVQSKEPVTHPGKDESNPAGMKSSAEPAADVQLTDGNGAPLSNIVLVQKAGDFVNKKQYAQARVCYEAILKTSPNHVVAKTKLQQLDQLEKGG